MSAYWAREAARAESAGFQEQRDLGVRVALGVEGGGSSEVRQPAASWGRELTSQSPRGDGRRAPASTISASASSVAVSSNACACEGTPTRSAGAASAGISATSIVRREAFPRPAVACIILASTDARLVSDRADAGTIVTTERGGGIGGGVSLDR